MPALIPVVALAHRGSRLCNKREMETFRTCEFLMVCILVQFASQRETLCVLNVNV